jgi:hypothetical protein
MSADDTRFAPLSSVIHRTFTQTTSAFWPLRRTEIVIAKRATGDGDVAHDCSEHRCFRISTMLLPVLPLRFESVAVAHDCHLAYDSGVWKMHHVYRLVGRFTHHKSARIRASPSNSG